MVQVETNLTSFHEDMASIPGLTQWVSINEGLHHPVPLLRHLRLCSISLWDSRIHAGLVEAGREGLPPSQPGKANFSLLGEQVGLG